MSNPDQYTVGWICALETEYVAARAFLDKKHSQPETISPNDNNHYTLGEIGGHQVVIAVLPDGEYGTSSAAGVARDMLRSFPNIRFGLMVGIGGGVPTKQDIRLGDVVVNSSQNGRCGLLQYDFGKELQGQEFHQKGFLDQPPLILRAAVSRLQAQYEKEGHRLKESIQTVLERDRRLKQEYTQPPSETDRLYESQFTHVPGSDASCAELCSDSKLILRPERTDEDPAIHYGLIASGNKMIEDAIFRDKLAAEQDVLCFEIEAAGLMNHFPCLVIRGVCDYADSHTSKEWQGYAAMVAAAYAKDLLDQIVPQMVNAERKAREVLDGIQDQLHNLSLGMLTQSPQPVRSESPTDMGFPSSKFTDPYLSAPLDPEQAVFKSSGIRLTLEPGQHDVHDVSALPYKDPNSDFSELSAETASSQATDYTTYSDFFCPIEDFSGDLSAHALPNGGHPPGSTSMELHSYLNAWPYNIGSSHMAVLDGSRSVDSESVSYRKSFKGESDPLRHIRTHNVSSSSYSCGVNGCYRSFIKKDSLREHMVRVHQNIQENKQDQCGRVFESNWDLPLIVAGIPDKEKLLLETLTLTRSVNTVRVSTCEQYIRERYGNTGIGLLRSIIRALENEDGRQEDHGIIIKTHTRGLHVSSCFSLSHLWDLLLWLCLTFRQPELGKVCVSTSEIDGTKVTLQALTPVIMPENTYCWSRLFETAIIATDPRTQTVSEMFLDTEFHLMLQLAAVEYPVMVNDGLVLMGYSTALVPVKELDHQTILWHLETANHDFQFKTADLSAIKGFWMKKTRLEELRSNRVLIGWCPEATMLLGTNSNSTVRWSDAELKKSTWIWKGVNLQFTATTTSPFQIGGQVGMTFDKTINTLRFSAMKNYQKCLTNSAMEQIILYDVSESRAWLVPLICVFHEMLLAYWQRIPEEYRKNNIPLARPGSNGASASLAALSDSGGCVIEGSEEDQLTIRDLILGFSVNLSKTSVQRPSRSEIYGYEFMDIVMDSPQSELKRNRIDKEALAWTPLLSQINCLFCSGLGDAILGLKANANGSPCNQLPRGFDWLATSVHSIDALNERHGSQYMGMARRLSSQHYWFITGTPFQKCQHGSGSQVSCWHTSPPLQEIKNGSRISQQTYEQPQYFCDGAVVFGRGKKTMCRMPSSDPIIGTAASGQLTQPPTAMLTVRTTQRRQHDISISLSSSDTVGQV